MLSNINVNTGRNEEMVSDIPKPFMNREYAFPMRRLNVEKPRRNFSSKSFSFHSTERSLKPILMCI